MGTPESYYKKVTENVEQTAERRRRGDAMEMRDPNFEQADEWKQHTKAKIILNSAKKGETLNEYDDDGIPDDEMLKDQIKDRLTIKHEKKYEDVPES